MFEIGLETLFGVSIHPSGAKLGGRRKLPGKGGNMVINWRYRDTPPYGITNCRQVPLNYKMKIGVDR